jgi:long-subunit acyl-CoA synthetase (AMP-forming)
MIFFLLHLTISFAGENVEPAEIEEAASRSNLINQIVVIGQVRDT